MPRHTPLLELTRSCLVALCFLSAASAGASAQSLRIYHIDVDQGDATLVVAPSGRTLLIDSGKNGHGSRLRAVFAAAGVTAIDHFVATHYHEDHYGGIDDLADAPAIPIHQAWDRGDKQFLPASTTGGTTFRDYQQTVGTAARHLQRGEQIVVDPDVTVTAISSGGVVIGEQDPEPGHDENDMSVSLLLQFRGFRYFIGGDIETATEAKIADHDLVMEIDAYQANHHGADNGSSAALLDDMLPRVIVISNGSHGTFHHPRRTALDRMQDLSPAPVIFQTNKYVDRDPRGGNVSDQCMARTTHAGKRGHAPDTALRAAQVMPEA